MTTATVTENTIQSPTSFRYCEQIIMQELADVLDHVDEAQIDALVDLIANARKVFFVGVGRVKLALEAIAKRLDVYAKETAPLLATYEERGLLKTFNGVGSVEEIQATIVAELG